MSRDCRKKGATANARRARARRQGAPLFAAVILALLAIFAGVPAPGAILVDSVSSAQGNTTTTLTWSHTVGIGPDRILVVGVSNHAGTQVTGVTYGGTPLAPIVSRTGGGNNTRASLFLLVAPPSGAANVVVTLAGPEDVVGGAVSFTGVEQTTPVGDSGTARGTGTLAAVTVAGAPGEVVVDAVAARGNGMLVTAGGGQSPLWNRSTGTGGTNIIGGGSTEPGAASVTMSWTLSVSRSWAIGAASLRPARVVPDLVIKLASEGAGAYLSDGVYENPAATQVKATGVMTGTTAVYNVLIGNDGNVPGDIRVTGTPGGGGFAVRYLDETGTDRTAAVTGGGYVIAGVAVGGSRAWTIEVTPSGAPVPVPGGTVFYAFLTATSLDYPVFSDQVEATTISSSPNLTMLKSADKAFARPGEDVAYAIAVSNGTGLTGASTIVVTEPIPANTGFRIGSATFAPGTSTLAVVLSYSDGAAWTYTPVSGGCAAPVGYDDCVRQVRWTMSGTMPAGTTFGVGFTVRIR